MRLQSHIRVLGIVEFALAQVNFSKMIIDPTIGLVASNAVQKLTSPIEILDAAIEVTNESERGATGKFRPAKPEWNALLLGECDTFFGPSEHWLGTPENRGSVCRHGQSKGS